MEYVICSFWWTEHLWVSSSVDTFPSSINLQQDRRQGLDFCQCFEKEHSPVFPLHVGIQLRKHCYVGWAGSHRGFDVYWEEGDWSPHRQTELPETVMIKESRLHRPIQNLGRYPLIFPHGNMSYKICESKMPLSLSILSGCQRAAFSLCPPACGHPSRASYKDTGPPSYGLQLPKAITVGFRL